MRHHVTCVKEVLTSGCIRESSSEGQGIWGWRRERRSRGYGIGLVSILYCRSRCQSGVFSVTEIDLVLPKRDGFNLSDQLLMEPTFERQLRNISFPDSLAKRKLRL